MGALSKFYPNGFAKHPVADLRISCQFVLTSKSVFNYVNTLQQENQTQKEFQSILSWRQYSQCITNYLPLTNHSNSSQCFFCTSLSQLLLAAVPINILIHVSHGSLPTKKLQNIPFSNLPLPCQPCSAFFKIPSYILP